MKMSKKARQAQVREQQQAEIAKRNVRNAVASVRGKSA